MANKELVSYIKDQIKNGYDINAIKQNLTQHGYSSHAIEQAVHEVYHGNFPWIAVAVFAVASVVILGAFLLLSRPVVPEQLLDIETTGLSESIEAGKIISFNVEMVNMGTKKAYDVILQHDLIDSRGDIVTSKQESVAVMTKTSTRSQLLIPKDTSPGKYEIETTVYYDNAEAVSSFMFKVEGQEDMSDEGDEEGVSAEECPVNCDDMNPCTKDVCDPDGPFICKHSVINPCCGNDLCEDQENYKVCAEDCEAPDIFSSMTKEDIAERAEELAETDIVSAVSFCEDISDFNSRDVCYNSLAEGSGKSNYCDNIISEIKRDSCYGTFASKGDLTVCPKITNVYMKESCEALGKD